MSKPVLLAIQSGNIHILVEASTQATAESVGHILMDLLRYIGGVHPQSSPFKKYRVLILSAEGLFNADPPDFPPTEGMLS